MNNDIRNTPLLNVIQQQKKGRPFGIYSVCSAHPFVLEACIEQAMIDDSALLLEATSNQVNQFGGYTGMSPRQFVAYIHKIVAKKNFPVERIILGGDHLGPNAWRNENATDAMNKACQMVYDYVSAGFKKIHLDTSMRCADDPGDRNTPLSEETIANRAAVLCSAAEKAYRENPVGTPPVYVIGTEVPIPGGIQKNEKLVAVTQPEAAKRTIEITKKAFYDRNLQSAWERVIALVVQPGVEFGDETVFKYNPQKAKELSHVIEAYDGLVYEAHSTDYQTQKSLSELVRDHFAILKVGPALTFAFREAVFALEMMEMEWLGGKKGVTLSGLRTVLDKVMMNMPDHWQRHYQGDELYLKYARKYSYSDRSRYYWLYPEVKNAMDRLISNLSQSTIPVTLLSQFMPLQYKAVIKGEISINPIVLIHHKIREVTSVYAIACGY